jgi:hypothetical protein
MRRKPLIILLSLIALIVLALLANANQFTQQQKQIQAQAVQLTKLEKKLSTLQATTPVLKNLNKQNIGEYMANLNLKINTLQAELDLLNYKHLLAPAVAERDLIQAQYNLVKTDYDRYRLDKTLIEYARLNYLLVVLKPDVRKALVRINKAVAKSTFPITIDGEEQFIRQGQILGGQGCSGVCTGSHLHFVVLKDRQPINPCLVLPKLEASRWGVLSECGTTSPQITWPVRMPWIITYIFGKKSDVTGTTHLGLDIIDRDGAAILAAHDGWYYSIVRKCTGASLCNQGAAKIAIVCAVQGCKSGLVTEYWHLTWMIDGTAEAKQIPISEFEER